MQQKFAPARIDYGGTIAFGIGIGVGTGVGFVKVVCSSVFICGCLSPMPTDKSEHQHGPGCDHDHDPPQEPVRRAQPKIGRNDPCHCGSGKKFKKCHGAGTP